MVARVALVAFVAVTTACVARPVPGGSGGLLLLASQVFDGQSLRPRAAVRIENGLVAAVGDPSTLRIEGLPELDLGDATILPGFLEPHAHTLFAGVPLQVLLSHGITTVRDLGGPSAAPVGGDGSVRRLTSGPILTAPGGYPTPVFGGDTLARTVVSPEEGRAAVRDLVAAGASVIKVALEPGGEPGAPWSRHADAGAMPEGDASHADAGHVAAHTAAGAWPLLAEPTVRAIVDQAHRLGRRTVAHVSEVRGVTIALDAGVDQWAHVPCMPIPDHLLRRAAVQGIAVITTLDTLSKCPGVAANARALVAFGATLVYGAEIAHADVPWGIDAEELNWMRTVGMAPLDVLRAATSRTGQVLGLSPLGTLAPGAPADLIAVRGNALADFKRLEYPDLVMSGGRIVFDSFTTAARRSAPPSR